MERKLPEVSVQAAYQAASHLVESLLHDARNPLNALAINLEVLNEKLKDDDGVVPESREKNIKAMREQIFRVDAILRQFAEYIAPRAGTGGEVSLSDVVQRGVEVLGHEARKRRVKLLSSVPPGLRGSARDGAGLRLLVIQTLFRALTRSDPGGDVTVTLQDEGERLILRVRDSLMEGKDPMPDLLPSIGALCHQEGADLHVASGECRIAFRRS